MVESSSPCITTAMMNIFWLPSKVVGKDPKKGGERIPRKVDTGGYAHTRAVGKHAPIYPQSSRISETSCR
jgi:hypothetical protein